MTESLKENRDGRADSLEKGSEGRAAFKRRHLKASRRLERNKGCWPCNTLNLAELISRIQIEMFIVLLQKRTEDLKGVTPLLEVIPASC